MACLEGTASFSSTRCPGQSSVYNAPAVNSFTLWSHPQSLHMWMQPTNRLSGDLALVVSLCKSLFKNNAGIAQGRENHFALQVAPSLSQRSSPPERGLRHRGGGTRGIGTGIRDGNEPKWPTKDDQRWPTKSSEKNVIRGFERVGTTGAALSQMVKTRIVFHKVQRHRRKYEARHSQAELTKDERPMAHSSGMSIGQNPISRSFKIETTEGRPVIVAQGTLGTVAPLVCFSAHNLNLVPCSPQDAMR